MASSQPPSFGEVNYRPGLAITWASKTVFPPHVSTDLALQAGCNVLLDGFQHGIYYQFLPGIYSSSPASELLHATVASIGLICLSLARNEKRLMTRATETHAQALCLARKRIACAPGLVGPFDVAAAVLLLGLFAVMSFDCATARTVWTQHVDGALTVLTLWLSRSTAAYHLTPVTQSLLRHVVNCAHISHLQRRLRLPQTMVKLYSYLPTDNLQARLHSIIDCLSDASTIRPDPDQDTAVRLNALRKLDVELGDITKSLHTTRPFSIVPPSTGHTREPVIHQYRSHLDTQIWNLTRILRLKLNEELLVLSAQAPRLHRRTRTPAYVPEWQQSACITTSSLIFDIYASVPSWLRQQSRFEDDNGNVSLPNHPDRVHWAHSLLWPLATAQASPHTPAALMPWIDQALKALWEATTFPGATGPEKQQSSNLKLKDWYVL